MGAHSHRSLDSLYRERVTWFRKGGMEFVFDREYRQSVQDEITKREHCGMLRRMADLSKVAVE